MPELPTYEFTEEGLKAALEALGTTPEAVAENLLALGCRGDRNSCSGCPVAVYLSRSFPAADHVSIDSGFASLEVLDERYAGVSIETPDPVAGFIERFDDSDGFADLVVSDAA